MAITDPLVLPADIILTPVADLPATTREQLQAEEGDYAITRPRSRTPSKILDSASASLLKEFQTPQTIVQAVVRYSQTQRVDAEKALEEALPLFERLMQAQLLVFADSDAAQKIEPSFAVGSQVAGCEVLNCLQVLEDTELYQVKTASGNLAALKILRPSRNSSMALMLNHEASILRCLDGQINPQLLNVGIHEERPYLLLEWCSGEDAAIYAEELRRYTSPKTRKQLLDLDIAILKAYAHLHTQGVLHSDIHPRNILVAEDGTVKLIDYGLARLEPPRQDVSEPYRGGIGFFFEPEYAQTQRDRQTPPQSSFLGEQYALAALVYLLLTGTPYLNFSPEPDEMLRQIVEDVPLPFSRLGLEPWLEVEKLLSKALSKDSSQRFASVAEFAMQLEEVATTAPEATHPIVAQETAPADYSDAIAMLNEFLQQVQPGGDWFETGITTDPTASVNFGAAGIAYALYRIASIRNDASLLSLADIWATRAAHNLNDQSFYSPELDITPETVGRISAYHTASGIHCVQALIGHAMGDMASQQAAIDAFISASKAPCDCLDLTLGQSSILLAGSLLLDTIPNLSWFDKTPLLDLGNQKLQDIWSKINSFDPISDCSEIRLSGIAHGWAGFLYATMRWCQSAGHILPKQVKERLQELADCGEVVGQGMRWPWEIPQPGVRTSNYMPGWCNGSAGFVYLWTLAYQTFHDTDFLTLAEKTAWNTWEEPDSVGNLCCGLAGRAYALLNLYKYTGEKNWLHRAQALATKAASSMRMLDLRGDSLYKSFGIRPDSLYKGNVGIAVLAADLEHPESACMPFFDDEGWPL
jgi:serine/threonine protein kinase